MININHHRWASFACLLALGVADSALAQTPPTPAAVPQTTAPVAPVPFVSESFAFGKGANGVKVADGMPYDPVTGYGFVSVPGGNEKAFSIKAPPGDYLVTAVFGDRTNPSRTSVWAEDRRLMTAPVVLKKGETRTLTFRVNVRDATLTPDVQDGVPYPHVILRPDDMKGRSWDDQLTISVAGAAPALTGLTIAQVPSRRVLIAGDSTVTDQAGGDYASWGQMLPRFLGPDVVVANHARSGETMKGFLMSLRWDKLMSETHAGDVVLIQFGHNDEKKQWPHTYAAADGAYPAYLAALVADVRQHGAFPVIISPVARRTFGPDGKIQNSHQGYDAAVRDVGTRLDVPVIDLTQVTAHFYEALGPDLAPMAFAHQGQEKTHHAAYGAWMIACFVAHDLVGFGPKLNLHGAADIPDCDPDHPVDPHHYEIEPADWPIMRPQGVTTQTAEQPPAH
jgi:lysophospholipase L1-like esterase